MKSSIFIIFLVIILLGMVGFYYIQRTTKMTPRAFTPSPTAISTASTSANPSPSSISYCSPGNLEATLNLSPGAGNVYGTFTLKNISGQKCQVLGGNFIDPVYDSQSVKNIVISHQGQTQSQPFELAPNQSIYSQVHYPNGPQCSSGINPVNIAFTYKISPDNTITFKTPKENIPSIVQACKSPTEMTQIQLWEMSDKPITP